MLYVKFLVDFDIVFYISIFVFYVIYLILYEISEKLKIKCYGVYGISYEYIIFKV